MHEKLNYVEFPCRNLEASKAFFHQVFGWTFTDHGPDYCSFAEQGLDGGFYRSELSAHVEQGSALLVFYSHDLESTQTRIEAAGGRISKAIEDLPGGRRLQFLDPSNNEWGVWSAAPPRH
ncbi:VOC family protein [Atopomonas sediminilitoris]|uniref:VOC family protein n=1 Tax=Atopomonas sediminilitoris TaxID=2919919 RepID=UPI001F4EA76A|nr:VOC family protein [Atopomonas sediminilitoris]MCJ8168304.1 VOC family protein [Atopomonas sediminilitoris]